MRQLTITFDPYNKLLQLINYLDDSWIFEIFSERERDAFSYVEKMCDNDHLISTNHLTPSCMSSEHDCKNVSH